MSRTTKKQSAGIVSLALLLYSVANAAVPDFNGDGRADVVWRTPTGNARVWKMDGLAPASKTTLAPALGADAALVGAGRFFGAAPDAIAWVTSDDRLLVWRVDGAGVTTTCTVASGIDPAWAFLGIGDVDRDGTDDVAWRLADGSVAVYLMNGCTAPATVTLGAKASTDWTFAGIGSTDGAHGALFWRNGSGDLVLWRLHNGTSIFSSTLKADTLPGWTVAAVADFDGDGNSDVLWRDPTGTQFATWFMSGTKFVAQAVAPASSGVIGSPDSIFDGTFDSGGGHAPAPSADWTIVAAADSDGDGDADLVFAANDGDAAAWRMQGSSIVASARIAADDGMPYAQLTGWRLPAARPAITKVDGNVTVAWPALAGHASYTVYGSSAREPARSGAVVGNTTTASLAFARSASGFADNRYFSVAARYHGQSLPPSIEAYIVEFTEVDLPYWGAMAIDDVNRDGCIDILGALGSCDGHFQVLAESDMGLAALRAPGRAYRDVRFADFDGDGIDDLVANVYSPINDTPSQALFFRGIGANQFVEDADFSALQIRGFGETIVVADFNNDGHLDLFLPGYTFNSPDEHCWLLINDGLGHFTDVSDAAGVAMRDFPLIYRPEGAQALDIDGDGNIDIYAGSSLFLNNGNLTFTNVGPVIARSGVVDAPSPWGLPAQFDEGAKFFDLDNSGQLALALNTVYAPPGIRVFKFDGVAHFSEVHDIPALTMNASFGLNAADVDGDGRDDLVVAGGCDTSFPTGGGDGDETDCSLMEKPHALPQLLVNRGAQFVRHDFYDDGLLPTQRGWNDLQTYADFDASGTVDVVSRYAYSTGGGQLAVLMNRAQGPDIVVTVAGSDGRHDQYGRIVRVTPQTQPAVTMTRVVDGGSGYMSNGPYDLRFAAPYPGDYTVSVRFASATHTASVRAGQHVTIRADGSVSVQ